MSSSPAAAPIRVFISYSHDSQEHMDRVLTLADRLRADGVDATIDQYEHDPEDGWQIWTEQQIRDSDLVLVVCTETYLRRAQREEEPGKGHGAIWEISVTYVQIYNTGSRNKKFIPVVFNQADRVFIPVPLQPYTNYNVSDDSGYLELYRRVTNRPAVTKPDLGQVKSLPQRERRTVFSQTPESVTQLGKPWNVPQERNPVFTGRDETLNQLRADLAKNHKQALSGLGGIGKTQIAVEYAYRHRDEYAAVLWTFADSEQSVSTGFAAIAKLLDLPEKDSADQASIGDAVKRWLQENENWLLVFDNADAPSVLTKFLLQQPTGHTLLTSRAHTFQHLGILEPIEVFVLDPAAAEKFLLKRTGRDAAAQSQEAEMLARELGYLPLALEQAGAYILENESSFRTYLASYRRQRLDLLNKQGPIVGSSSEQQKRTIATAWAVNFGTIENDSPASADVLRVSAFLAPDEIPLELLEKGGAKMGERLASALSNSKDDPLIVDELLKPLTAYSLIQRNPENRNFSIHPLVQEVIRDGMRLEDQKLQTERTVKAIEAAFPDPQFQNWSECDRLLPHSLAAAKLIESYHLEVAEASELLNRTAVYLDDRAQYTLSESLAHLALDIDEKTVGPDHLDTARSLNNLGLACQKLGKHKQAELFLQRSLAIKEKALHPKDVAIGTGLNNLAELYREQGRSTEAEPLYRRALEIYETALGREHPNTATILNNLALFYQNQRRYSEAEALFKRALDIDQRILGADHPDTAVDLCNLGFLYHSQSKNKEAEPFLRQALAIFEKALGPKHPWTITCGTILIACQRALGKRSDADELQQRLKPQ